MADQFLYGAAGTLYFPVYAAGGTQFATNGDWTPGGTCALITKDGGALDFASGTVTYVGSKIWSLPLTAVELQCKRLTVLVQEPGTIDDQMLTVDTLQNNSAHWPVVLGSVGTVSYSDIAGTVRAGTVRLAVAVGTTNYVNIAGSVRTGSVDLAVQINGGTVDAGYYVTQLEPAYNVNDDKFVAAGWVEKDGVVQNATSATFNLYTYDGTLVFGSSAWDAGPTEVSALNTWFVSKNTATAIKGGTTYVMVAEFDLTGVNYSRTRAFGAYGTGTGA